MSDAENSEQVLLDYWYTNSFTRLSQEPNPDFELDFRGRLSEWLRSQGRDVDLVTGYEAAEDKYQGYFVIMYQSLDGSKKYLRLPVSFECLRGKA